MNLSHSSLNCPPTSLSQLSSQLAVFNRLCIYDECVIRHIIDLTSMDHFVGTWDVVLRRHATSLSRPHAKELQWRVCAGNIHCKGVINLLAMLSMIRILCSCHAKSTLLHLGNSSPQPCNIRTYLNCTESGPGRFSRAKAEPLHEQQAGSR